MPKKLDFKNLRICLDNYNVESLFIRDCGGIREDGKFDCAGRKKILEQLEGKNLDFRKDDSGLYMLINSKEIFHFPLKHYYKGFSLAYERIYEDGRYVVLSTGIDPEDPSLPKVTKSILRTVLDDHLMEIDFEGKISLKFHSWWDKSTPYWQIDKKK